MALGKTVVTTTKGVRGISGEDGKHFIVADDEEKMAKKILDLISDEPKRKEIGSNAKKLIKEKYRWDTISKDFYREIDDIFERNYKK